MPEANSDAGGEQMGKWISATVARPRPEIISFHKLKLHFVVRVSCVCSLSGLLNYCEPVGFVTVDSLAAVCCQTSFSLQGSPVSRGTCCPSSASQNVPHTPFWRSAERETSARHVVST